MPQTLAEKIIGAHLAVGRAVAGEEIALRIDQTLTQDATGTLAYLQFETLGLDRTKAKLSLSYVDHNTLQSDQKNADDHRYLETVAARYGIYFSRPGNGICHQVHPERFAVPGETLIGSDSHTPTCGGMGMLAIGVGGLEIAAAMAGEPYYLTMPEIILVRLSGKLRNWVSAKDVILELLGRFGVKWGKGKLLEYGGEGVESLSVPERASITNMGTELGLTSSIFPSDGRTRRFLASQRRERCWKELTADHDARYSQIVDINLGTLKPLIAAPHSPGNVRSVREMEGIRVDQVCLGSCTNSSLWDMYQAAAMLRGRRVSPHVSFTVSPGSRQVLRMMAESGVLGAMIAAGARILENACGPCIGMGQAPLAGGVSLRTCNRNFEGRSGTPDAKVYLCSPAVAVASAIAGKISDPRRLGRPPVLSMPENFLIDDSLIIPPPRTRGRVKIMKGPNIKPVPVFPRLPDRIEGTILLECGDHVTTDDIMPAGAKILPLRSNIPAISEFVFENLDPTFSGRARKSRGGGIIVGGENYGQGSSREHAALAPRYLGVRAVIAKSFARIHQANLVNFGIVPLTLEDPGDLRRLRRGDSIVIMKIREAVKEGRVASIRNATRRRDIAVLLSLTPRQRKILLAGGLLNMIRKRGSKRRKK